MAVLQKKPPNSSSSSLLGGLIYRHSIICKVALGCYGGCSLLGFLTSLATASHVHLDLIGTGAFGVGAAFVLTQPSTLPLHVKWSSYAILLWSLRLALFLFYRATQLHHDGRLTQQLSTHYGMFEFWFITYLWNLCTSMPYLLGLLGLSGSSPSSSSSSNGQDADDDKYHKNKTRHNHTNSTYYKTCLTIGMIVFGIGFLVEFVADTQKWNFKQEYPSKFCNVGLWQYSQHPNYFGNLLLWMGLLVANLPALLLPSLQAWWKVPLALTSPIFLYGLFYGQATGQVLNAVGLAQAKYGHDSEYASYLETTPLIFPTIVVR